ncbi:ORF6N domain protein [Desulfosporosinus acididurans]|uniref:ORF6N domain protein n=1 Tax=Desulfosporosinus acididurans TaxID=476652 RepID=A0A0J1FTH7_9FIRM|nr:phage antirepressor KilAC domain-containing protein [Desulfosporosinus acididurans]KLU66779.1 ORF6N domain protein [Desulfosporosinus acididurans]
MNELIPIEYKGQRILITEQLAEVYETEPRRITENFQRNQAHFTIGRHYHLVQGEELKAFLQYAESVVQNPSKVRSLYLWTERGANRHCKILDTDRAWEQFDLLEETYFKSREFVPQFNVPQTFGQALRLAADLWDQNQLMRPKAEYFDALVDKNLLTNFRDTAKELKIKEHIFINWLLGKGYVYRDTKGHLKPYADYVPALFEIKEKQRDKWAGTQTFITPRGRETFRLLLKK